ncbi:MAG TPA: hypothetical protein VGL73_06620, partial [Caulobacteraceae bacterium]
SGITGATNAGACPTGGTANLATRAWDFHARTFSYDLAGRLTGASNDLLNLTYVPRDNQDERCATIKVREPI